MKRSRILILVLSFTYILTTWSQKPTLRIGTVFLNDGFSAAIQNRVVQGQQMWQEEVNDRGGIVINGTEHLVEIIKVGVPQFPLSASTNGTMELINQGVDFLLLPFSSERGELGAIVANEHKINSIIPFAGTPSVYICDKVLRPPCAVPFGRRFKYSVGLTLPSVKHYTESLNLLASHGARTVAIIWEDMLISNAVIEGALRSISFQNLNIIYKKQIPFIAIPALRRNTMRPIVEEVKEKNPDIIVMATFFACEDFIVLAKELDFNANAYLFSAQCITTLVKKTVEDSKYILAGGFIWDERLRTDLYDETDNNTDYHHFVSNGTIASPMIFYNKYIQRFGEAPRTAGAEGYVSGYVIQYAYETANTFDSDKLQMTIDAMDITGFYGEVAFDRFGQNLGRNGLTYQVGDDLSFDIVAPLFAATTQLVYPVPKWNERQPTFGWYKQTSEHVMLCLVSIVILITFGMIVWVLICRHNRVIRASQPLFVVLTLFGTIFMYATVFFWTLHTDDVHCNVVRWLLGVGFGLTYGAMFARIYRIGQIFLEKSLEVFKVTNMMIIPIVTGIVTTEVLILAVWTGVSPSRAEREEVAPYILSDDYFDCTNTTIDTVFLSILLVFNACVLLYGIYWVYRIWRLKAVLYNESKAIGFAVYTLTFFIIILIIIQVFGSSNRSVAFILRSLCLILGPFISILSILIPRMYYMTLSNEEIDRSDTRSNSVNRKTPSEQSKPNNSKTSVNVEELLATIETLRKELKKARKGQSLISSDTN